MTNSKPLTLTPRDMIAGLPALRVRQALMRGKSILWPLCADQLAVDPQTALAILDHLVAERYLTPGQNRGQIRMWTRSPRGNRVARANVPEPIPREDALPILNRTISFVNSINRLPVPEIEEHVVGVHVIGELLSGCGLTIPHLELEILVGSKIWFWPASAVEPMTENDERAPLSWATAIHDRLVDFDPTICFRMRKVG